MRVLWLLPLAGSVYAQVGNDTLLWGTYRPNLYFGIRPRIPQSLMTGLMWFGTQDYQSISRTRHACDQGDGLQGYTWTEFDARDGGVQVIKDSKNNVILTTEFVKVAGGDHGGSWAARIKGEPIDYGFPSRISTIFYFGLEGLGGIDMDTDEDENGLEGEIKFSGSTPELDEFTIRVVESPDNVVLTTGPHSAKFADRIGKTHFLSLAVPSGQVWQAKDLLLSNIFKRANDILQPYRDPSVGPPDPSFTLQLSDESYTGSNLHALQKTFDGPFQYDVFFESASSPQKLSPSVFDASIQALKEAHDKRFKQVFPIPSDLQSSNVDRLEAFSKAITSNLLGGVGYFYGTSLVDRSFAYEWDQEGDSADEDEDEDAEKDKSSKGAQITAPMSLLTATPSRSFFPRGFYWDEGFHLLHISEWDNDFGLEILKSWIKLIDNDGWVAREQILGEEARSKVPAEFQVQVPRYANPPTLTMAVTAFIDRLRRTAQGPSDEALGLDHGMGQVPLDMPAEDTYAGSQYLRDPELSQEFLRSIYKPLRRHYDWFRRTQRGQIKQYSRQARSRTEAYRWRGRSEHHVLTSGMDDYPRGPPHAGELHLDLISWMGFFTRTMRDIAKFIDQEDDYASFVEIEQAILDNIEDLHWSEKDQMYCDVSVDDEDESYFVCHKGYLSLFPFFLSLLPSDSPHLGAILDLLYDPDHLWSPYGLRSLSASHPEFGQGENYWKGPIWMQMNYMALKSLHQKYAKEPGPYQAKAAQIYSELRKNVVENVFNEYERTGYVWEQYDAKTGEGKRSHPFTGWTSLVTLIISEKY